MTKHFSKYRHHFLVVSILFISLLTLIFTNNPFGKVADHTFFIVHLISNKIYFLNNGLFSIPYYLPSFNGGFPQYADPQDMTFSLIQFSVHFFNNIYVALKVAFAIQLALCYFGMFKLMRKWGVSIWLASWAGVMFAINGFNIARWSIGHLTFHSYWTLPWVILSLMSLLESKTVKDAMNHALKTSLFAGFIVYASDVTTLYISTFLSVMFLTSYCITQKRFLPKPVLIGIIFIPLFSALLAASRLTAIYDMVQQFPRTTPPDTVSLTQAILIPFYGLFDGTKTILSRVPFLGSTVGWFEYTTYIGPIAGLGLIWGAVRFSRHRQFALWALLSLIGCMILMLRPNPIWDLLRNIPGVSANHAVYRIIGGLPLVCIGLAALGLQNINLKNHKTKLLVGAICFLSLADVSCLIYRTHTNDHKIITLEYPRDLTNIRITQWNAIDNFGGVMAPNPMFGWDREKRNPQIDLDLPPNHIMPDNTYNTTDPAAILYPDEINRQPWSRLPNTISPTQLAQFLSFKDPHFYVPMRQKVANFTSFAMFLVILVAHRRRSD